MGGGDATRTFKFKQSTHTQKSNVSKLNHCRSVNSEVADGWKARDFWPLMVYSYSPAFC